MKRNVFFFPQALMEPQTVAMEWEDVNPDEAVVKTPDGKTYKLAISFTDSRMLAVVDGDIPTGGLSLGAEVVHSEVLEERLIVSATDAYEKRAESEEEPAYIRWRSRLHQNIRRHAVLFQSNASLLLRRYDYDTLKPVYVTVMLSWGKGIPFTVRTIFSC